MDITEAVNQVMVQPIRGQGHRRMGTACHCFSCTLDGRHLYLLLLLRWAALSRWLLYATGYGLGCGPTVWDPGPYLTYPASRQLLVTPWLGAQAQYLLYCPLIFGKTWCLFLKHSPFLNTSVIRNAPQAPWTINREWSQHSFRRYRGLGPDVQLCNPSGQPGIRGNMHELKHLWHVLPLR